MKKRRRARPRDKSGTRAKSIAGATVEVEIERLLPGGMGLAHTDGRTLLVALAAPGDRVRARIERVQGRVCFASIEEIVSPSPVRVEPPCPYFGRCGGCDFQQLSYEAQLAAKSEIIRDCLRRVAKIDYADKIPVKASQSIWHYRSRAQWQRDPQRKYLGYFERGSHRVCDVAECPVLVPELEKTLEGLREKMKDDEELPATLTEFQAVAGDEGASLVPPLAQYRTREVTRTIAGNRYHFSAAGFFQINHELLGDLIVEATSAASGAMALDLYCGAGLFTLPLAKSFDRVLGVEANAAAISFARQNAEGANLSNVTFSIATVGVWLSENSATLAPVDFILLDPPRAGVEDDGISGILALRPRRISYVSCDPATLARDLKALTAGGYKLDSITAFDMFPQTHHVETVAHLIF